MYTELASKNEYVIHCTPTELENIYFGLFLALNTEKDRSRKKEIRKQITAIETINPKIEF